jgi:phosphatidylinositol alpha-1,6-mannosyltransferase
VTRVDVTVPRQLVFLSTDFRPMLGGVADHVHRLADAIATRIPTTVMTTAPQGSACWHHAYRLEPLPPLPERRLDGRFGDRLAPLRKLHTGAYFLALRRYAERTIARVAAAGGRDAAVVIGIWDMAAHFWCAACRRAGMRYYLLAHGAEVVAPLYGRLPAWRAADFGEAARVIANSSATASLAAERLRLAAVPAVVNPSVGPPPSPDEIARGAEEMRRTLRLHDGPTVLSVGRLVPRKGFDLALRSVASVSAEYPGLHYVIAGEGPEAGRLESLTRDLGLAGQVHFMGQVNERTKWAAYDACDVFVMPNRVLGGTDWEGFGIVFLEAALSGRPSIGGRTGGAGDAVVDEVTGLLVDPESPDELTGALRRLLRDGRLRDRLGRAGLDMARTRFTPAAAADRLWSELGGTGRTPRQARAGGGDR